MIAPTLSFAQFIESFESADLPSGWKVINVTSGTANTWIVASSQLGARPHHGNRMMEIAMQLASSVPHNDYLVTPAITVQAGVNDQISFYARNSSSNASGDVISVKISTTGNEASDFNITLQSNYRAPDTWSEVKYDLTSYIGQTIYVAVQNTSPRGGARMFLDYFVSGPKPAPQAGCKNAPDGQYPSSTFDARTCTGATREITDDGYAGEYSVVRLTAGEIYTFSSSISTDFLTITSHNSQANILAYGTTPVIFTPGSSTTFRVYHHTDNTCGTQKRTRSRFVKCGSPPPPLVNDEASGAIEISLSNTCTGNGYDITRATAAADEPLPGCGLREDAGAKTLWFKFTAPHSGAVRITTDFAGTTLQDPRMALYAATDPADYSTFINLACDDDGGVKDEGWKSIIYYTGLTEGETYYIQVEEYQHFYSGAFCLEVSEINATMLSANSSCTPNNNTEFGELNYSGWTSLTDDEGKIIALVKNNDGMPSGSTSELLHIHNGQVRKDAGGNYYLSRNFTLNNSNPGPFEVVLFFLRSEFDALTTANPAIDINSLGISRQANSDCSADFEGSSGEMSALEVTASGLTSEIGWVRFTTPSFSNFFINAAGTALPVSWVGFTATVSEGGILLEWSTAAEKQNKGFLVERSIDGRLFSEIGRKDGSINSSKTNFYQFTDRDILPGGLRYYRIRQVDLDGTVSSSAIRSVFLPGEDILLSPNPASDRVQIHWSDKAQHSSDIVLTDIRGHQLRQWKSAAITDQRITLDTEGITPGLYILQITVEGKTKTAKLLIK